MQALASQLVSCLPPTHHKLLPTCSCTNLSLGCLCRFLDRLDPDNHIQSRLGVHQAWCDHPLLDSLPDHPQGVQVLLERIHMSQPPMHVWTAAAGAGAAAVQTVGAGAGYSGQGGGGGSSVAARGVSPGKLVLALLLKTGEAFAPTGVCLYCFHSFNLNFVLQKRYITTDQSGTVLPGAHWLILSVATSRLSPLVDCCQPLAVLCCVVLRCREAEWFGPVTCVEAVAGVSTGCA